MINYVAGLAATAFAATNSCTIIDLIQEQQKR